MLGVADCVADRVWLAVPEPTNSSASAIESTPRLLLHATDARNTNLYKRELETDSQFREARQRHYDRKTNEAKPQFRKEDSCSGL